MRRGARTAGIGWGLSVAALACARAPQPPAPLVVEVDPSASAVATPPEASLSDEAGPAPGRSVASRAADSASADATHASAPPATAPIPTLDPASCAAQAAPADAHCNWTVASVGRCGGAALRQEPPPAPVCVCNGCERDSDCAAKPHGKCETFYRVCAPRAKACVYPGEPCADDGWLCSKLRYTRPGNRMSEPEACVHDGHGHAVCGPRQAPPP